MSLPPTSLHTSSYHTRRILSRAWPDTGILDNAWRCPWHVWYPLMYGTSRGPASYTWRRTNSTLIYFWLSPHTVGSKSRGGKPPWLALHSVGRVPTNRKNQVLLRRAFRKAGWDCIHGHLCLLHTASEGTEHVWYTACLVPCSSPTSTKRIIHPTMAPQHQQLMDVDVFRA
jgi:hypothetical protein